MATQLFYWIIFGVVFFHRGLTLQCDPSKHVYYHKQLGKCLQCQTCPVGFGKISVEESKLDIDPVHGAFHCTKCRPCKAGYFSSTHSYYCDKCTNCTLLNKVEMQPCSLTTDTHCSSQTPNIVEKSEFYDSKVDNKNVNTPTDHKYGVMIGISIAICIGIGGFAAIGIACYKRCINNRNNRYVSSIEEGVTYSAIETDGPSNVSDDVWNEVDEHTPLINPTSEKRRKRIRLYSEPTYIFEQDVDHENQSSVRTRGRSLSDLSYIEKSGSSENVFDSEFAHISTTMKPHERLVSFGVTDACITDRIKQWESMQIQTPFNQNISYRRRKPSSFIRHYASHKVDALRKVEEWELKDDILTTRFMSKVARHLAHQYQFRLFARHSGLDDTDLSIIQHNHKDDVVEQAYQVLLKLKEKEMISEESDVYKVLDELNLQAIMKKL